MGKPAGGGGDKAQEGRARYLEVVLAVYSEAVAEHVPGDHHVGLHAVHGQAVHAQELWQERVAMTLHYELEQREEGAAAKERWKARDGWGSAQAQIPLGRSSLWASRFQRGPVKSWGLLGLNEATAIPTPSQPCQVRALGLLFLGRH